MVQLQRFGARGTKLDTLVQCPLTGLDLSYHRHQTGVSVPCMYSMLKLLLYNIRVCMARLHRGVFIYILIHYIVLRCVVLRCIMSYAEVLQLTLPGAPYAESHVCTALACRVQAFHFVPMQYNNWELHQAGMHMLTDESSLHCTLACQLLQSMLAVANPLCQHCKGLGKSTCHTNMHHRYDKHARQIWYCQLELPKTSARSGGS